MIKKTTWNRCKKNKKKLTLKLLKGVKIKKKIEMNQNIN